MAGATASRARQSYLAVIMFVLLMISGISMLARVPVVGAVSTAEWSGTVTISAEEHLYGNGETENFSFSWSGTMTFEASKFCSPSGPFPCTIVGNATGAGTADVQIAVDSKGETCAGNLTLPQSGFVNGQAIFRGGLTSGGSINFTVSGTNNSAPPIPCSNVPPGFPTSASVPDSFEGFYCGTLQSGVTESYVHSYSYYGTCNTSPPSGYSGSATTTVNLVSSTGPSTQTASSRSTALSSTSNSTGGGIPEFPFQILAATFFTVFVVASYLLIRRRTSRVDHAGVSQCVIKFPT